MWVLSGCTICFVPRAINCLRNSFCQIFCQMKISLGEIFPPLKSCGSYSDGNLPFWPKRKRIFKYDTATLMLHNPQKISVILDNDLRGKGPKPVSRIKRILRISPILPSTLVGGGVHCQKRRKRCRKLSTRSRVPQLSLYSWNSFSCRSYIPPIYLFLTTKFNLLFTRRSSLYNQRHNRPRHYSLL